MVHSLRDTDKTSRFIGKDKAVDIGISNQGERKVVNRDEKRESLYNPWPKDTVNGISWTSSPILKLNKTFDNSSPETFQVVKK